MIQKYQKKIYINNDFDASIKSSNIEIKYTDITKEDSDENAGTLMLKNFNVDSGWCAEISGKAARGGKACHGGVNDVLRLNGVETLPTSKPIPVDISSITFINSLPVKFEGFLNLKFWLVGFTILSPNLYASA